MSGKPVTSKPVYGYLMDEDENYIVDEEPPVRPLFARMQSSASCALLSSSRV